MVAARKTVTEGCLSITGVALGLPFHVLWRDDSSVQTIAVAAA